MTSMHAPNEPANEISLATATAGIVIAVLFLLISSYVSAGPNSGWDAKSHHVWTTTTLKVDGVTGTAKVIPVNTDLDLTLYQKLHTQMDGHSYDALYRQDFMTTSTEPT
jgi:hypothetical protein